MLTYKGEEMELKDTIELMTSKDYKDRFRAEYYQTLIRYRKLEEITIKYEAHTLEFEPECGVELLKEQLRHMGHYIRCLRIRAEIEGIEISKLNV